MHSAIKLSDICFSLRKAKPATDWLNLKTVIKTTMNSYPDGLKTSCQICITLHAKLTFLIDRCIDALQCCSSLQTDCTNRKNYHSQTLTGTCFVPCALVKRSCTAIGSSTISAYKVGSWSRSWGAKLGWKKLWSSATLCRFDRNSCSLYSNEKTTQVKIHR